MLFLFAIFGRKICQKEVVYLFVNSLDECLTLGAGQESVDESLPHQCKRPSQREAVLRPTGGIKRLTQTDL